MKKAIAFALFVNILISAKAQTSTFSDVLKSTNTYGTYSLSKASSGDYFFSGLYYSDSTFNVYCTRLDDDGKKIWEKTFSPSVTGTDNRKSVFSYVASTATSDNGVILFTKSSPLEGLLIKNNVFGKVEWSKKFIISDSLLILHHGYIDAKDIIEDDDGNFWLLYQLSSYSGEDDEQIRALKFDKNGELKLQTGFKNIVPKNGQYLHINKILETKEGGCIISFSYQPDAFGEEPSRPFLIVTNPKGKLISYKQAPFQQNWQDKQSILHMFKKESSYFLFGTFYSVIENKTYYYVSSFNLQGNFIKTTLIPYNLSALQRFAKENDIRIKYDDVIINKYAIVNLIYSPENTTLIKKTYVIKYDSAGKGCTDTIATSQYDTSSIKFRFGPLLTADKAVDSLIIKDAAVTSYEVNNIENICSTTTMQITNKNSEAIISANIFISPNPSKNVIFISVTSETAHESFINIVDSYGKSWQTFSWNLAKGLNNKRDIISELKPGLYFLDIKYGSTIKRTQFLKE